MDHEGQRRLASLDCESGIRFKPDLYLTPAKLQELGARSTGLDIGAWG